MKNYFLKTITMWTVMMGMIRCADLSASSDTGNQDSTTTDSACVSGERRCDGKVPLECRDGIWVAFEACQSPLVCDPSLARCVECIANESFCSVGKLYACDSSGKLGAMIKNCRDGSCPDCPSPCQEAAQSTSYLGCEYWPTMTSNSGLLSDHAFAVVVTNPHNEPIDVVIARVGGETIVQRTIGANKLETITLPWDESLKSKSGIFTNAAMRLTSTLPIAAYQFNPLEYKSSDASCKNVDPSSVSPECYSYSSDASLLLPTSALNNEYLALNRETLQFTNDFFAPGFISVVAVEPGTTEVVVTLNSATNAGESGMSSHARGETVTFQLPYGSVMQLHSALEEPCVEHNVAAFYTVTSCTQADLTGTLVSSNRKIAVFSGHDCATVPADVAACDHLEEQLIPVASWGEKYIASHSLSSGKDPSVYRVVSGANGNRISFIGGEVRSPVDLNRGEFFEFISTENFIIEGKERFSVAQFMVGQNYSNKTSYTGAPGDPALVQLIPIEQYRLNYQFLAPTSYEQNYVNVIARVEAKILLDGTVVSGFKPIETTGLDAKPTGWAVAQVPISGGPHFIEGDSTFGIIVYGVGSYTSYMYPGGLDVRPLID